MAKLSYARIAYTLGDKTDELVSGFLDIDYLSQTSFSYISTNSSTILMVSEPA